MIEDAFPLLDVSMVVNIHAGRNHLGRTMSSLEASARFAAAAGLKIELLLALDRSPPDTQAWVDDYRSNAFHRIRVVWLDNGSLGLSRQDGLRRARAEYVQFCDEDDLVSSNTTLRLYQTAVERSARTIVVPEYLYGFGAVELLAVYANSRSIPTIAFFSQHPFISRIFVHRSITEFNHFIDVRLGPGYAYEDWHFNASAIARGLEFAVAPGVILFYRHHANSLSASMNRQSARLIPPTPLFEPLTYLALAGPGARRFITAGQDAIDGEAERSRFLTSASNREEVRLANRIDPAVSLAQMKNCPIVSTRNGDFASGAGYFEACRRVSGLRFTDVAIVASPDTASAEAVLAAVRALSEADDTVQTLILVDDAAFDEDAPLFSLCSAVMVNLGRLVTGLSSEQRHLIAYRLIEMTSPGARLHLAADLLSASLLGRYGRLLADRTKLYYKSNDAPTIIGDIAMIAPGPFDFLSEFLEEADLIVHSSKTEQEFDRARLDRRRDVWALAPLPVEPGPDRGAHWEPHRRILVIGAGASETCQLRRRCAEAGLSVRLETAAQAGTEPLDHFDLAVILDAEQASYRMLIALLCAGLPIVGADAGCLAEIAGRSEACLTISASQNTSSAEAADWIAAFYADASLRQRLTEGIRDFLTTHHSPADYRSHIARLVDRTASEMGCNADDTSAGLAERTN